MTVVYPAKEGAKFDMDYYLKSHMPLVEKTWKSYGLKSVRNHYTGDEQIRLGADLALVARNQGRRRWPLLCTSDPVLGQEGERRQGAEGELEGGL